MTYFIKLHDTENYDALVLINVHDISAIECIDNKVCVHLSPPTLAMGSTSHLKFYPKESLGLIESLLVHCNTITVMGE